MYKVLIIYNISNIHISGIIQELINNIYVDEKIVEYIDAKKVTNV